MKLNFVFSNKLKVSAKLLIGFSLITLILLAMGEREFRVLRKLGKASDNVQKSYTLADNCMEAKYFMRNNMQLLMELRTAENAQQLEEAYKEYSESCKLFLNEIDSLQYNLSDRNWANEYEELRASTLKSGINLVNEFNTQIIPHIESIYKLKKDIFETANNKLMSKIDELDHATDKAGNGIVRKLLDLEEKVDQINHDALSKSEIIKQKSKSEVIWLSIIAFFQAILISTTITVSIMKQLGGEPAEVNAITQEIAKGNLAVEFDADRKKRGIYGALQDMTEKMSVMVVSVINAANNVAAASQQISVTTQQISSGASEQASTMEEFSSTIEELTNMVKINEDASIKAGEMASLASQNIMSNSEAVKGSSTSMNQIVEKISIIGEIAMQTNILSLNASVEAARAGEHGHGFAVVANEVRSLAARSHDAANEINDLSINGVNIVEMAREQFEEIVPEIDQTTKLINEISLASREQSASIHQINSAIQTLNQVTQENAASTEEMASGAEELANQAEELKEMISFFKIKGMTMTENPKPETQNAGTHFLHVNEIENRSKNVFQEKGSISTNQSIESITNKYEGKVIHKV